MVYSSIQMQSKSGDHVKVSLEMKACGLNVGLYLCVLGKDNFYTTFSFLEEDNMVIIMN